MLRFVCNNLLRYRTYPTKIESTRFLILQHNPRSVECKLFSKKARPDDESSEGQDNTRVLTLFRNYGFTEPQISNLMAKRPELLLYDPDKTLKPKLDFFNSIGVSAPDLAKILALDAPILKRSLENQIIPSYQFLKSELETDENVIFAIKRSTWVLKRDLQKFMAPNIVLLKDHGVPDYRISYLLRTQPRALMQAPDNFRVIIEKIMGMGFDPLQRKFLMAILAFTGFSQATWEQKLEAYRKWGWSDDEILSAFMKAPACMVASVKKIDRVMDFLVNEMGWHASDVAGCPVAILYSLENWTAPRFLVIEALLSKGLIKKDLICFTTVIASAKQRFLNTFVDKYCTDFPELMKLYERKVCCEEFAT